MGSRPVVGLGPVSRSMGHIPAKVKQTGSRFTLRHKPNEKGAKAPFQSCFTPKTAQFQHERGLPLGLELGAVARWLPAGLHSEAPVRD